MPRMDPTAPLHFELMFHPGARAAAPSAATVENYRPDPGAVQVVRAWLARQGIESSDAGFSVAASAPAALFEQHFGQPSDPRVPQALSKWVQRVILPPTPTFF